MASGWLQEGKDSALFKGQAAESLSVLQGVHRYHKLDFFSILLGVGESQGHRG